MILYRRRIRNNVKQLPDIEIRKAGGIYAQLAKSKLKPDPLKTQLDYLYSNWIQSHVINQPTFGGVTERFDKNSIPQNDLLLSVKRDFIKKTLPHKLNPITQRAVHEFADHNKPKERPNTDAFNILDPQKESEELESEPEVSAQKQELKK